VTSSANLFGLHPALHLRLDLVQVATDDALLAAAEELSESGSVGTLL
jgi:hypothetical protein